MPRAQVRNDVRRGQPSHWRLGAHRWALAGLLAVCAGLLPAVSSGETAQRLYGRHCAVCHGEAGRGEGPAMASLHPRPRDFTSGVYKLRSTPSGTLPMREDLARSIRRGLPGTSMPGYEDLLVAEEIDRLAGFLLGLAPATARPGAPLTAGRGAPDTLQVRERGKGLFVRSGCAGCHGPDGRPLPWRPRPDDPGGPTRPTVLSEPWTFRGGADLGAVALRILTGIDGGGMPGFAGQLTPDGARAVAAYVATLARVPIWAATEPGAVRTAGVEADPVDRGRYLVRATQCMLCHTPISPQNGAYDASLYLAGGMRVSAYPWGVWYSRNITSDEATGLGRWREEEIVQAVTRGVAPDGRRLHPMAMSWPWFSRLTPADVRAIAAYLKRVPAIRNPVPLPEPVPLADAVGGRLAHVLGAEAAVEFWGGNAASDPGLRGSLAAPPGRRAVALALGWGTLTVPLLALTLGLRPRRRRWPWISLSVAAAVGWWVLAGWPPTTLMSPELTAAWLLRGTPQASASLTGARLALAERGAYLAAIAPCGLCHTPVDALVGFRTGRTLAGGMEARWRVYGSQVSVNLTPHPDGIAGMGDATVLRAMRSGIASDGRPMHWQAMSWDIISNWSEEDQRAMLAYLRALPPVPGRVPPPRGPREGDPASATFFFGDRALR